MPKIWKENYPFESSQVPFHGRYGLPEPEAPVLEMYFIEVCGFTFEFCSIEEITVAREWFKEKIHKSTRMKDEPYLKAERDVLQRWHERLPAFIKKGSKRERVIKAFDEAINKFS